jgi:hypothetical protein
MKTREFLPVVGFAAKKFKVHFSSFLAPNFAFPATSAAQKLSDEADDFPRENRRVNHIVLSANRQPLFRIVVRTIITSLFKQNYRCWFGSNCVRDAYGF